jgi:hypothetical protein
MKNNQVIAALTGILVLSSVWTFYETWSYRSSLQRMGVAQMHAAYVKSVETPVMQSLLNDTAEYSKKNPAVMPILQSLTNNMSRSAAAAKPATK